MFIDQFQQQLKDIVKNDEELEAIRHLSYSEFDRLKEVLERKRGELYE